MRSHDLLLRHGALYDPAQALHGQPKDIAIAGGRVVAIADRIDPGLAAEVTDLAGALVSPGWIDMHVHGYGGLALRDIQAVGVLAGVTTNVDAGDFGTATFDDFMVYRQGSVADMYGYVHMHPAGIPYTGFARGDYRSVPVGRLVELIAERRDVIKGLKLSALGDLPIHNLKIAKIIAETAGVPYYMHIGEVNNYPARRSITRQAVSLLTEGDIITHVYTNDFGRILDAAGRVFPEVVEARRRGVVFDVGHGAGNFSFDVAERALAQGIAPDVISSDQNTLCLTSPSDLPTVMSKFLVLGLSVDEVIRRVTRGPREALGLQDAGTLVAGARADVTVFHVEAGDFEFTDAAGGGRRGRLRIVPDVVYKAGRRHACDAAGLFRDENFRMVVREAGQASPDEFDAEERRFLAEVFRGIDGLRALKGEAVHLLIHETIAARGLDRRRGLDALYRLLFGEGGAGFTPQIGWLMSRLGAAALRRHGEAIVGAAGG